MKNREYKIEKSYMNYVNPQASLIIVGLTPGNTQIEGANTNCDNDPKYKKEHAFKGTTMRNNIIKILSKIDVDKIKNIEVSEDMWNSYPDNNVEFTSILKDAVYYKQKEQWKMLNKITLNQIENNSNLENCFDNGFKKDVQSYKKAKIWIACGSSVASILRGMELQGTIIEIPHPSGANNGRIKIYLDSQDKNNKFVNMREKGIEQVNELVDNEIVL